MEACRLEAHVRFSTCGAQSVENCHPFWARHLRARVCFLHNGILFNEELLAGYDRIELGETDSERTMLFLLDVLDEATMRAGCALGFDGTLDALAGALAISNLNRQNLIMDDGTYTSVHTNTSEDTLNYRQLSDDAIVFSTKPLGGDAEKDLWKPVPRNRLIAYRDGTWCAHPRRTDTRSARRFSTFARSLATHGRRLSRRRQLPWIPNG